MMSSCPSLWIRFQQLRWEIQCVMKEFFTVLCFLRNMEDFLKGLEICENDGAVKLWGSGRITNHNLPDGFHGDADEGVYMWPHVYENVTED